MSSAILSVVLDSPFRCVLVTSRHSYYPRYLAAVQHMLEVFKMSSAPSSAELLHVGGERTTGENIRTQNGTAERKILNKSQPWLNYLCAFIYSNRGDGHREHCQKFPRSCWVGQNVGGWYRGKICCHWRFLSEEILGFLENHLVFKYRKYSAGWKQCRLVALDDSGELKFAGTHGFVVLLMLSQELTWQKNQLCSRFAFI